MYVKLAYGSSFSGLMAYQWAKERDAENRVIGGNLMFPTTFAEATAAERRSHAREVAVELDRVAQLYPRATKPVAHVIVAWHPDDKVSDLDMAVTGDRLLDAMEVDRELHQHVYVRHEDTEHPHMHIVFNRVGIDGSFFKDEGFPGRKMREEADHIEQEMKYVPAIPFQERLAAKLVSPERQNRPSKPNGQQPLPLLKREGRTGLKSAKHLVYRELLSAINHSDGTFSSLDFELRKGGRVAPDWSFNSKGEFNGASFTFLRESASDPIPRPNPEGENPGTYTFKGSQLGPQGGMSKRNILRALERRREQIAQQAHRPKRPVNPRSQFLEGARTFATIARSAHGRPRMVFGRAMGKGLRANRAYRMPLSSQHIGMVLKLFDSRYAKLGLLRKPPLLVPRPFIRKR